MPKTIFTYDIFLIQDGNNEEANKLFISVVKLFFYCEVFFLKFFVNLLFLSKHFS